MGYSPLSITSKISSFILMASWLSSARASIRDLARSFHTLMRQSCEQLANNSSPPERVIERTWKPSRNFIQCCAFDSNLLLPYMLISLFLAMSQMYSADCNVGAPGPDTASQKVNKAQVAVSGWPPICCMMHLKLDLMAWGPDLAKTNTIKNLSCMGRGRVVITVCPSLCWDDSYYSLIALTWNSNCIEVGGHLQAS